VPEPGASIQNWYNALEQPEATPVTVIGVPAKDGEVGAADAVTEAQTVDVSV